MIDMTHSTLAAALISVLIVTPSLAQEPPANEVLKAQVADVLPPSWQVISYEKIASKSNEDPVSPQLDVRFEAVAETTETLYLPYDKTVGPFDVLIEALPEASQRTLYGTVSLSYRAGKWSGEPVIENSVVSLGAPLDSYEQASLILGSERYASTVADIQNDRLVALESDLAAKMADLRTEHENSVAELKERNAAALRAENEENIAKLMKLEQQLRSERQRLSDKGSQEVASLEAEIQQQKAALRDEIEALQAQQRQEINSMKAEHAQQKGALEAQIEEELAALQMGFATRLKEYSSMAEDSEKTLQLQETLIQRREAMLDNENWLNQLNAQNAQMRKALVAGLKGTWSGSAECSGIRIFKFAFSATFAETKGGALAGKILVESESEGRFGRAGLGKPLPAILGVTSEVGEDPIKVKISTRLDQGPSQLLNMEMVVRDDGSLLGTSGTQKQCQVIAARG